MRFRLRSIGICFCSAVLQFTAFVLPTEATVTRQTDPNQPIWLPRARARVSRGVYSEILKSLEGRLQAPAGPWLIADLSLRLENSDLPCQPIRNDPSLQRGEQTNDPMNPHQAIIAPQGRERDFHELLDDYDHHCHDLIEFSPSDFGREVRIELLDEEQQRELTPPYEPYEPPHPDPNTIWLPAPPVPPKPKSKYADAAGFVQFGEVFFNRRHTVAMVLARDGGVHWTVLEKREGVWTTLSWRSMHLFF